MKICLLGAGPDTGNLGVSALCFSVVHALARLRPGTRLTVFDSGAGVRRDRTEVDGRSFEFARVGGWNSWRMHRSESMWSIRACAAMGGLHNPGARAIIEADAALDISGGDSFSDLYGPKRFRGVTMLKKTALACGTPLVLLPQTYGPFVDPTRRRTAEAIVRRCAAAWARDAHSFDELKRLLGDKYDPSIHLSGVDVAFRLEPRTPAGLAAEVSAALARPRSRELVGLNVSGLILNGGKDAAAQYSLKADYQGVVVGMVKRILDHSDAQILLTPHVHAGEESVESDLRACTRIREEFNGAHRDRLLLLTGRLDQSETKWVIAQTDWFCGTRMHATIASLSSGIPTAAISYSGKTLGVFESCGQGPHVHDPRWLSTEEMIDRLWASFGQRSAAKAALQSVLPAVVARADQQMNDVIRIVERGMGKPAASVG